MAMMLNRGDRGSAIPTELKFGEPYFIPGTGLFIGNESGVPEKVSGSENLEPGGVVENTVKEYLTINDGVFTATHNIKKVVSIKPVVDGSGIVTYPYEFPLSHFKIPCDKYMFTPNNVSPEISLRRKMFAYQGPNQVIGPLPNGETILLVEYVPEISETFDTEIAALMGVVSADTINYSVGYHYMENKNNVNGYFQFFPPVTNATYEWILTFPDLSEEIISTSPDGFYGWLIKDFMDVQSFDATAIYKLRGKMVWNGLTFESNNFEFSPDSLITP